jgi:tetratricopeptide (TPR) repeat protein
MAQLFAQLGRYEEAISLFEQLADHAKDDSALKFSVHTYLSNSCYCIMYLGDVVRLGKKYRQYVNLYPIFSTHPDADFLREVVYALEKSDATKAEREIERYMKVGISRRNEEGFNFPYFNYLVNRFKHSRHGSNLRYPTFKVSCSLRKYLQVTLSSRVQANTALTL